MWGWGGRIEEFVYHPAEIEAKISGCDLAQLDLNLDH